MLQLWSAILIIVLGIEVRYRAMSTPIRVRNVNWKCAEGAPCLAVVRPIEGLVIVGPTVDSYKMEVMVHRSEGPQERVLQKWSKSISTSTWNVEVSWYRFVEKSVRIPMQQCKNKLICVVMLLDDDIMASNNDDVSSTELISHHFQVTASYQGNKRISGQEIIIERQISGKSYFSNRAESGLSSATRQIAVAKYVGDDDADVEKYKERKEQKVTEALLKSGLYSGTEEEGPAERYEARDTYEPVERELTGPSVMTSDLTENIPGDTDDTENDSEQAPLGETVNAANSNPEASSNGSLLTAVVGDSAMIENQPSDHYLGDATIDDDFFARLGPTATVIILLSISILVAFACACCYNRIALRSSSQEYKYQKMNRTKKVAPKVRAGKKHDEDGEATGLLDDSNVDSNWDDDSDDDNDNIGRGLKRFGRKISKKGSEIFSKLKNVVAKNKAFQEFKKKANEYPQYSGAENAASDHTDKQSATSDRQEQMKELCSRLRKLCCSLASTIRDRCLSFCRYCREYLSQMQQKRAQAKVFEFTRSSEPRRGSDGENDDDDEVNLLSVKDIKRKAADSTVLQPSASSNTQSKPENSAPEKSDFIPRTDISGRFYVTRQVKILRDSSSTSNRNEGGAVVYPSSRATNTTSSVTKPGVPIVDSVAPHPTCSAPTQSTNEKCSCDQNSGDTGSATSPLCRTESLHSPLKQRCGLHCIQQRSHPTDARVGLLPQPLRPPLPPRISRTPPPRATNPPSSSSSSELIGLENVAITTSDTSSFEDNSQPEKKQFDHGDTGTSNKSVLEKTKDFFRRENEHMDALLRSWEDLEKRNSSVGRRRPRPKEWLANKRSRRRELYLQHEARAADIPCTSNRRTTAADETVSSEPAGNARTGELKKAHSPLNSLKYNNRLKRSRAEETSPQRENTASKFPTAKNFTKQRDRSDDLNPPKKSNLQKVFLPKRPANSRPIQVPPKPLKTAASDSGETLSSTTPGASSATLSSTTTPSLRAGCATKPKVNRTKIKHGSQAAQIESPRVASKQRGKMAADIKPGRPVRQHLPNNKDSISGIPRYSVVKKPKAIKPQAKNNPCSPKSKRITSHNTERKCQSSDEEFEFISAPNSPRKTTKASTFPIKNSLKGHPPDNKKPPIRSPRSTLNSAALDFFREEDYESMSTDEDDEDEFWNVCL